MTSKDQKEEDRFKVTDRRGFTEEGDIRPSTSEESPPADHSNPPHKADNPKALDAETTTNPHPTIDLSSFILSLATTAVMHMGEGPGQPGATPQNLEAAKQMVDILGMLQEKTDGNRTPEETRLLDDILYDIRMKFLAKNGPVTL
jgi:hypothetical protein